MYNIYSDTCVCHTMSYPFAVVQVAMTIYRALAPGNQNGIPSHPPIEG